MTTQPDPGNSGQGHRDGTDAEHRGGSQSRDPGRNAAPDITGEIQRWLIRSGARNMRRELTGQFRRTFNRSGNDNVWSVATTEPPPDTDDAPECAWCPVCRAARRIRESNPGLSAPLSGAGDVVASAVHEALAAFDAVLSMRPRGEEQTGFPANRYPADRFPADRFRTAGTPPEGADHEPDDRD
jgi:hypothetical protein